MDENVEQWIPFADAPWNAAQRKGFDGILAWDQQMKNRLGYKDEHDIEPNIQHRQQNQNGNDDSHSVNLYSNCPDQPWTR